MHKTLLRQLERHVGDHTNVPAEWKEFFDVVSSTYDDFDREHTLIERSLEVSSAELKGLVSMLKATLDSTNDGILVVGMREDIINYNKRFLEIIELDESELHHRDAAKVHATILAKVANPELLKRTIVTPENDADESNDTIVFKDGRVIERFSKPQQVDGKTVGRIWSYRDITLRVQAENQQKTQITALEKLNRVMVDRELKMIELKQKIKSLEEKLLSTPKGNAPL